MSFRLKLKKYQNARSATSSEQMRKQNFPYFGPNQVWDGQRVIHCKDVIVFDTVNIYNPPSKKQKRLDGIRKNLVNLVPSNQQKLWKLYIEKCLEPACSIWSQVYPNSNYPLPMTLSYFDQNHNDTIKGFIYFCIMHSHIQLRTKGKLDKKDKKLLPFIYYRNRKDSRLSIILCEVCHLLSWYV
jgi:hypothetical protein